MAGSRVGMFVAVEGKQFRMTVGTGYGRFGNSWVVELGYRHRIV